MLYRVEYSAAASKAIKRLPSVMQRRVYSRIGDLAANPRSAGTVKLSGRDDYRIRVGDYRVIFTVYDDRLVVLVIDVGHRRDVYRK